MIDATIYAGYMTAIADRLKFPLSDGTNALYYTMLSAKMDTDQFKAAAGKVFSDYQDFGFPPPSVFVAALAESMPPVDAPAVLRRISALGSYNPHTGWQYPRPEVVREALGGPIADAYGAAGGAQCFADADRDGGTVTRDIATRRFTKELSAAHASSPAMLVLGAPDTKWLTR